MTGQPLVSVVVPTYDRLGYLREAVESVMAQTYRRWELIVVDDGSTDGTRAWLDGLDHDGISCHGLPHSGNLGRVRNAGLALARGEYIALLDSDDAWEPDKLRKQLAALRGAVDSRWSYTALRRVGPDGGDVDDTGIRPWKPYSGWILPRLLTFDALVDTPTVMAETALVREAGGWDEGLAECQDYDLFFKLAERAPAVAVAERLTRKRVHEDCLSADRLRVHGAWVEVYGRVADRAADRGIRSICRHEMRRHALSAASRHAERGEVVPALRRVAGVLREWPLHARAWRVLLWHVVARGVLGRRLPGLGVSLLGPSVVLLGLLAFNLYWARPYHNWDMLAYVGVAYGFEGVSPPVAHARVYESLRQAASPERYALLTAADEFRRTMEDDATAFQQQLSFYRVKPAYPLSVLGLTRMGLSGFRASVVVSTLAYVGLGLVLLVWLRGFLSPPVAVASAWAAMSLPFALDLARLSTPDALSTLLVILGLWLGLWRRRFIPGAVVLLLSLTVRPDNLLWLLAMSGYTALRERPTRVAALIITAAGVLLVLGVDLWAGHPGWRLLLHHSFIEKLTYPEAVAPSLSLVSYLGILARQSHPVNLPPFLILLGIVWAWLLALRLRRPDRTDRSLALLAVVGLFTGSHWLVYPGEDRFLVAAYLVTLVILFKTLAEAGAGRPPARA